MCSHSWVRVPLRAFFVIVDSPIFIIPEALLIIIITVIPFGSTSVLSFYGQIGNHIQDRIVQWLTRSPDTRKIPSSSLGMVIFLFYVDNVFSCFFLFSVILIEAYEGKSNFP